MEDSNQEMDPQCGDGKPTLRYCHIPALSGYYEFTNYSYFTADTAHSICDKVGGSVPMLKEELEAIWLRETIAYLTNHVNVNTPFTIRWITWPVSLYYYNFSFSVPPLIPWPIYIVLFINLFLLKFIVYMAGWSPLYPFDTSSGSTVRYRLVILISI